jgi:cell division protein ZapD
LGNLVITFEYPLNERIRTLLRLEDLFERTSFFLARQDSHDHHIALVTMFEILEVASRADLKSDLLQELERQKNVLMGFRSNPEISEDALDSIVSAIEQTVAGLLRMNGKVGQHIRDNEWLMSIKQRTVIPGGVCEFDLPSYHFWLNRDLESRSRDLANWLNPMLPVRDGLAIVLRLLRTSGKPVEGTAHHGAYQQMLGGRVAQMVRIKVSRDSGFIPEISANKYALNVRFTVQDGDLRPKICESDVAFELTFCNL